MRINGFQQIKGFYSWVFNNADKRLTTSHVALYNFLVNQNNRNNWVEWFKCPYDLGMAGSCIGSKTTYYKCMDNLAEWGLIEYQKGVNNFKAPLVKLCLFDNGTQGGTAPVPQSEPLAVPLPEPLTGNIYKLLTSNPKLVKDNLQKWIDSEVEVKQKDEVNIYVSMFNEVTGKAMRVLNDKTEKQIKARLKEGYTFEDIKTALESACVDSYHVETKLKYITLEFITRTDKLERYVTQGKQIDTTSSREQKEMEYIKSRMNG